MFVSPFTVSLGCDAAVIVVYLQRAENFGGTPWFAIAFGQDYTSEMVDVVRDLCLSMLLLCTGCACSSVCTDLSAMWHGHYCYLMSVSTRRCRTCSPSRNEVYEGRNIAIGACFHISRTARSTFTAGLRVTPPVVFALRTDCTYAYSSSTSTIPYCNSWVPCNRTQ